MDRSKLVEFEFRGGPWDGHELAGDGPPEEWFALPGGRYGLAAAWPSESEAYELVAVYRWAPAAVPADGGSGV
jgi:hypothetical protein